MVVVAVAVVAVVVVVVVQLYEDDDDGHEAPFAPSVFFSKAGGKKHFQFCGSDPYSVAH